jgi:hypothetical protein
VLSKRTEKENFMKKSKGLLKAALAGAGAAVLPPLLIVCKTLCA